MKRLALLAAASASLSLFGCDSASTTSPDAGVQASVNNSDNRKASYTPATAEDRARLDLKLSKILQLDPYERQGAASGAAARLGATPRIAYLIEPTLSYPYGVPRNTENRLFMHTETDGNADHVAPGSAWEVINHTVTPVSSRANPVWWDKDVYINGNRRWHPEQTTGINGLRYAGAPIPIIPRPSYDKTPQTAYPWHNGTTPGLDLYWRIEPRSSLPRFSFDYIVLRLSPNCPEGGYPFTQHFDEEDVNNQSGATFDLSPGWSGPGATGANLAFCFVPGTGVGATSGRQVQDQFIKSNEDEVAIFAAPPAPMRAKLLETYGFSVNTLVVDAEDTDWAGQLIWETLPAEYQGRVISIMYPAPGSQTPYLSVLNFSPPQYTVGGIH